MSQKATESKLGALHGHIADAYTDLVTHEEEEFIFDAEGEQKGTGVMKRTASPALLAGAAKFLKDNNITADKEQVDNLNNLHEALAKKTRHSDKRLGNPTDAAKDVH